MAAATGDARASLRLSTTSSSATSGVFNNSGTGPSAEATAILAPDVQQKCGLAPAMEPAEANGDSMAEGNGTIESGPDQQHVPAARSTRTTRRMAAARLQGRSESESGDSASIGRVTRSGRGAKAPALVREGKRGRGRASQQAQDPETTESKEVSGGVGDEDEVAGGSVAGTLEIVGSETEQLVDIVGDEKVQTVRENGGSSSKSKGKLGDDCAQEEITNAVTKAESPFHPAVVGIVRQDSSESTDTEVGEGSESKGEVDNSVEGVADSSATAEESPAIGVADQGSTEIVGKGNGESINSNTAVGDGDVSLEGAVAAASAGEVNSSLVVGVAKSYYLESMDMEGHQGAQSASNGESSSERQAPSPQSMEVVDEQGANITSDGTTDAGTAGSGGAETTEAVGTGGGTSNSGSSHEESKRVTNEDGDKDSPPGRTETGSAASTVIAPISVERQDSSSAGMELEEDAYRTEDVVDFEAASEGAGEALSSEDIADPSVGLQQASFEVSTDLSEEAVRPSPSTADSATTAAHVAESSASAEGTAGPVTSLPGSGSGGLEDASSGDATAETKTATDATGADAAEGPSETITAGSESSSPCTAAGALTAVGVAGMTEGAESSPVDQEAVDVEKEEEEASVPALEADASEATFAADEKSGTVRQLHGTGLSVVVKKSKSKEKKGSSSKKISKSSGASGKSAAVGHTAESMGSSKPSKAKKKELKSATKVGGKAAAKISKLVAKVGLKTKTGTKIGSKGNSRSTVEEPTAERGGKGGKVIKGRVKSDKDVSL